MASRVVAGEAGTRNLKGVSESCGLPAGLGKEEKMRMRQGNIHYIADDGIELTKGNRE